MNRPDIRLELHLGGKVTVEGNMVWYGMVGSTRGAESRINENGCCVAHAAPHAHHVLDSRILRQSHNNVSISIDNAKSNECPSETRQTHRENMSMIKICNGRTFNPQKTNALRSGRDSKYLKRCTISCSLYLSHLSTRQQGFYF